MTGGGNRAVTGLNGVSDRLMLVSDTYTGDLKKRIKKTKKKQKRIELNKTNLYNPSLTGFVPVDDQTVEHNLTTLK